MEDPLAPEENAHYANIRSQTSCPIAQGELFTNQAEWLPLIVSRSPEQMPPTDPLPVLRCELACWAQQGRLIDYIRVQ